MDPPWHMLGGLEAANGILMAGISTAAAFWLLSRLFQEVAVSGKRKG